MIAGRDHTLKLTVLNIKNMYSEMWLKEGIPWTLGH